MKNQEQPKLTLLLTKWLANECRDDEKPELLIDAADYPRAARQIRDLLASEPCIVERGTPMKVMKTEEGPPKLIPLTADQIVLEVASSVPARQGRQRWQVGPDDAANSSRASRDVGRVGSSASRGNQHRAGARIGWVDTCG
jgi:hypothetical protein